MPLTTLNRDSTRSSHSNRLVRKADLLSWLLVMCASLTVTVVLGQGSNAVGTRKEKVRSLIGHFNRDLHFPLILRKSLFESSLSVL